VEAHKASGQLCGPRCKRLAVGGNPKASRENSRIDNDDHVVLAKTACRGLEKKMTNEFKQLGTPALTANITIPSFYPIGSS